MNKEKPLILVADDSPTMRSLLKEIVTSAGYNIVLAEDGLEAALQAFRLVPDLIISDIEMPRMNGYQVCRLLKNHPRLTTTPVIILTSLDSKGSVFWGYQTGADLYLLKDFQPQELLTAIKNLFGKYNRSADTRRTDVKPEEIDPLQISEMLNDYLDARLFEMTLINEINRISLELTSVSETFTSLLETLCKVYESYASGIAVFKSEKEIFTLILNSKNLDERAIEQFSFNLLQDLSILISDDISENKIDLEVINPEETSQTTPIEVQPDFFLSYPIRVKEENLGVLNIMHPQIQRIPDDKKQLLDKLNCYVCTAISAILMYNKIKDLSLIDGLTQIYNRRHVMEIFKLELNKVIRNKKDLCLLMVDVDDFKNTNDQYGHLTGDLVLKSIAGIIKTSVRNIDIPGRYGGEEFIVILPETTLEQGRIVAERIRSEIEKLRIRSHGGAIIKTTVSIGLSATSELSSMENELELIRLADARLYQAKKSGKNRIVSS